MKETGMTFKNTGVICMISVQDCNRKEGFKHIDLGNYFTDSNGNKCLVTTKENATKYSSHINVPIYVRARGNNGL
jgi:hypothetical protein